MNPLQEISIRCPCCGESISLLADASAGDQQYVEDCQVCCRPMEIRVTVDEEGLCRIEPRAADG